MSSAARQFPFIARDPSLGTASLAPMMPLSVQANRALDVMALVDTGAAVNVLPYDIGLQLGLAWDRQTTSIVLTGNLASVEARAAIVTATVPGLPPARLAFAWAKDNGVPTILGQVNFFLEFDVCFFRSRTVFEVRPKSRQP